MPAHSPPSSNDRDRARGCKVLFTKKKRTTHPICQRYAQTPLLQAHKCQGRSYSRTTLSSPNKHLQAYNSCCCIPELKLHYLGSFSSATFKTGKTCPASATDASRHQQCASGRGRRLGAAPGTSQEMHSTHEGPCPTASQNWRWEGAAHWRSCSQTDAR
uniref:Uncharacterized protein n=1 Tax=Arundo donax TaxID=35708 RepID=A0A0A8YFG5_ARUDO